MTRRQRTKRRAQRWARRRWLGRTVYFTVPMEGDIYITEFCLHDGKRQISFAIDPSLPITSWQLPEHATHWLTPHTVEPLLARADLPRHEENQC